MSIPTVRTITRNERAWLNREFQMFCGRFELDQSSGLFFAELTPGYHRQMIGEDFLALPLKLREVALYLGLTVSTTKEQRTSSGHASAVYGDWDRPHSKISPHLEMSVASLDSTRLCLAHLAHECSHLFWAVQPEPARAAYIQKMLALVEKFRAGGDEFVEVTAYAQRQFDALNLLPESDDPGIVARRARLINKWAMESFCESVAKLCFASYQSEEGRQTDELLAFRLQAMKEEFDFDPTTPLGV